MPVRSKNRCKRRSSQKTEEREEREKQKREVTWNLLFLEADFHSKRANNQASVHGIKGSLNSLRLLRALRIIVLLELEELICHGAS